MKPLKRILYALLLAIAALAIYWIAFELKPPTVTPKQEIPADTPSLRPHSGDSIFSARAQVDLQKEPWTMDSIAAYLSRMRRCAQLNDSAKGIYIRYAQGAATFEQYQRAHRVYERYYRNIYEPSYKRLCAHTGGGKP